MVSIMKIYTYYQLKKQSYEIREIKDNGFLTNIGVFHFATTHLVGEYCYFISLYELNERQIEKLNKLQKGKV